MLAQLQCLKRITTKVEHPAQLVSSRASSRM